MKFSIAIPTYNSSQYLNKNFNKIKRLKNLKEVVLVDDNSTNLHVQNLLDIKSKYEKFYNVNLIINKKNLGGFSNKYKAISNCSEDLVYQIDSDNLISDGTIELLNSEAFLKEIRDHQLYLPSKIMLFKKNYETIKFFWKEKTFSKKNLEIEADELKKELLSPSELIENNSLGYLLNLGNPIVNKQAYLDKLAEGLENTQFIGAACSIAMCYYWLKNGGSICLNSNFSHHHRLREDSYWIENKDVAPSNYEEYLNKIKTLNNE